MSAIAVRILEVKGPPVDSDFARGIKNGEITWFEPWTFSMIGMCSNQHAN